MTAVDRATRWLRILLATDWTLVALAVPLAFLLESTLPPQIRAFVAAQDARPFGAIDALQLAAISLSLLLWFVGSVGAFLLWPPARHLYLASVITSVAFTPFVGLSVLAPLASAFDLAASVISGAVVGLLYFSPLRDRLRRPSRSLPAGSAS